jgi:hypothetical protein
LGDENTGKKSLLSNYLSSPTPLPPSSIPSSSLLSYDYLLLSDDQNSTSSKSSTSASAASASSSFEFSSKINVWSLNERNFQNFHGVIFDFVKKNQNKVTPLPTDPFDSRFFSGPLIHHHQSIFRRLPLFSAILARYCQIPPVLLPESLFPHPRHWLQIRPLKCQ